MFCMFPCSFICNAYIFVLSNAGLKKVTKDMQTHKNPALRAGSTVPPKKVVGVTTAKPFVASKPVKSFTAPAAKKPPVMELQNKKWVVEYHEGRKDLMVSDTNLNQTVYMFKCSNCVLQIKGKINSVILGRSLSHLV